MNNYQQVWLDYLENNYFPTWARYVKTIEYSVFKDMVNNDFEKTKQWILDMLSGDIVILKNAIPKDTTKQIREDVYEYRYNVLKSDSKTNESILPNSITKNLSLLSENPDKEFYMTKYKIGGGGYDEIGHSYYFYRWNEDEFNIFSKIDDVWNTVKKFNGLDINDYKSNKSRYGIIDRIQTIHYPINVGGITTHCDWLSPLTQKTNLTISLTERGENFESGGQYFLNKKEEKVDSEFYTNAGDAPLFVSSIFHGVNKPRSSNMISDWEKMDGRWQIIATNVQSSYVKNRVPSYSLKRYKKNSKEIAERYREELERLHGL